MNNTSGDVYERPPDAEPPHGHPSRRSLLGELRTAREPLRLGLAARELLRAPRGDGRLTIDIPGWRAPASSMVPIRSYLGSRGHQSEGWGLGVNGDDVEATVEQFVARLETRVAANDGRSANLVGWSLGGVIAREAARERGDLVNRVVVFGTPVIGGPSHTAGAPRFGAEECARVAALQAEADRDDPITRPLLAMFTKQDGVVDWRACIDRHSTDVTHQEMDSTHIGLGLDPGVWLASARFLTAMPTEDGR